jgi:hypothetical protein
VLSRGATRVRGFAHLRARKTTVSKAGQLARGIKTSVTKSSGSPPDRYNLSDRFNLAPKDF